MLRIVSSLLNQNTGTVKMELKFHAAGQYELVLSPVATFADGSDELTVLKAALSMPIRIVGSTDEIEQALCERISTAKPVRNQWAAAVERAQQAIEAQQAKPGATSKARPGASQKQTSTAEARDGEVAVEAADNNDFDL